MCKPKFIKKLKNKNAKILILKCIKYEKKSRPSIKDILNHKFFINNKDDDEFVMINENSVTTETMYLNKKNSSFDALQENNNEGNKIEINENDKKNLSS